MIFLSGNKFSSDTEFLDNGEEQPSGDSLLSKLKLNLIKALICIFSFLSILLESRILSVGFLKNLLHENSTT